MAKKAVKKAVEVEQEPPEEQSAVAPAPEGKPVLYVLDSGPNAGAIRPGTLLDQGGPQERIEVQTEKGDELPTPLTVSLIQHVGAPTVAAYNGAALPGSWHWPAE